MYKNVYVQVRSLVYVVCVYFLIVPQVIQACIYCDDYDNCIIAKAFGVNRFIPSDGLKPSDVVKAVSEIKTGIVKKNGGGQEAVYCKGNQKDMATCVMKDSNGNVLGNPVTLKLNQSGKFVVQNRQFEKVSFHSLEMPCCMNSSLKINGLINLNIVEVDDFCLIHTCNSLKTTK